VKGSSREELIIRRAREILERSCSHKKNGRERKAFARSASSRDSSVFDYAALVAAKSVDAGDDCAVWPALYFDLLTTTDMLIEGTHFIIESGRKLESLFDIGWKALAVNVSDIAACGGDALGYLVSLGIPGDARDDDVLSFTNGLAAAARKHNICIWGGDLVKSDFWTVNITAVGAVPPGLSISRSGARPGDAVVVSGHIGLAAVGMNAVIPDRSSGRKRSAPRLNSDDCPKSLKRFRRPDARLKLGLLLRENGLATAMIDTSDSLAKSIRLIAEESGTGAEIDLKEVRPHPEVRNHLESLARTKPEGHASSNKKGLDGTLSAWRNLFPQFFLDAAEDYELLFTMSSENLRKLRELHRGKLTWIGRIVEGGELTLVLGESRTPIAESGFEHFE